MTLNRFFTVVLFLVITATVANAYTLVMRNGRRVEIPNEFVINGSMLTYQVGSGIQMTLQLSGIDIGATERANREASGSFLARGNAPAQVVAPAAQAQPRAQRSVTNLDLEGYRRTRIESELAYEKRRKELDLPSVAQQRAEFAALEERTRNQLMSMRSEDESAEQYWRSRASALRTEETTTLAQINYVRTRLDEIASAQSSGVLPIVNSFGNGPFLNFPMQNGLGGSLLNTGLQAVIGLNNGHRNMGNRRFPFGNNNRFNRFRRNRGPFGDLFGGNNVLVVPSYPTYDYSYERAELANQLDELQMRNAALRVRWRELEDEARRAGAYPGWLRP